MKSFKIIKTLLKVIMLAVLLPPFLLITLPALVGSSFLPSSENTLVNLIMTLVDRCFTIKKKRKSTQYSSKHLVVKFKFQLASLLYFQVKVYKHIGTKPQEI